MKVTCDARYAFDRQTYHGKRCEKVRNSMNNFLSIRI